MIPIFESKNEKYYYANYKKLICDRINNIHFTGGTLKKTKTRIKFYDARHNEISESISYFPKLLEIIKSPLMK
jgi:hypothetical protein